MDLHWFHPPCHIETDKPGLTSVCTNVEGAAAELMKWTKRGPKWKEAVEVCMGFSLKASARPTTLETPSRLPPKRRECCAPLTRDRLHPAAGFQQ
ncbi:hypothetical protein ABID19_002900 [Mesorhizobium robiniae]|uniref:DUF982 domain-containing protein n=1 Tax=Mesorhizobium robiniae TaxID=559315 RepID=A0ABV2GNM0_9HYPH